MGFGRITSETCAHLNKKRAVVKLNGETKTAGFLIEFPEFITLSVEHVSHIQLSSNGDLLLMRFGVDGEAYGIQSFAKGQWLQVDLKD